MVFYFQKDLVMFLRVFHNSHILIIAHLLGGWQV